MDARASALFSMVLAALLGAASARAPVPAGAEQAMVASAPAALVAEHLVLAGAPATETGGDACSEIVPLRVPQASRHARYHLTALKAAAGARPAVALQRALAALGLRGHPPTAPPLPRST